MQGQKGAIGSLPESLALEHGSGSSDSSVVEQPLCWNNYMRNPPPNRLSDYISPTNTSDMFLNTTNQESENVSMWTMGESSSSSVASQGRIDPKTEHGWSSLMKACPEAHQHELTASMLSLGDVNMNITHNHANNGHHGPLFVQTSRPDSVSHNVTVNPSTFIGIKPSNYAETYVGSNGGSSSSDPFELEGRQLPCKRKAAELSVGQSSSGIGSSNMFQRPEGSTSAWHSVAENPPPVNAMPSDQIIPRLGLGVGGASSEENTRRNVRIRINASRQQDVLPANNNNGQSNLSSPYPALRLNPVDLRSPPVATTAENSSSHEGQPILQLPALRRNLQASSRWNRSSSSRANRSSNTAISDYSRTMPTNISDHPIFVQPRDIRNAAQTAINWSLNGGGGSASNNGNGVASTTRASSNSVPAPSTAAPNLTPHRGSPHYPSRRLSEILRRSLLSSIDSGAGAGQSNNLFSRLPPAVGTSAPSSQETGIPPLVGIPSHQHRHHLLHSRSSDRQLDRAFGFPYLAQTVPAGSEGRGRLVSEIRNVLDLIRRGEGLRFEEFMLLDQSVFYGMTDVHDRHRDMRLDIDNMSYEELLALEERIGNVNTGLTEDTISSCLKQKTYATVTGQPDAEPCCICQEEFNNGDDLGALECGHAFHKSCIKQWLLQKNLCPVCKSAASATSK